MPTITITINTDNAAFHDDHDQDVYRPGPELARILHDLANELEDADLTNTRTIRDTNGNRVGDVIRTESQARNLATGIGHMIPKRG